MNPIDEKLSNFSKATFQTVERECREIIDEIEAERKKTLTEAEKKILLESYYLIQSQVSADRERQAKDISQKMLEYKKQLIMAREEQTTVLFEEIEAKLFAFCRTDTYRSRMTALLQEDVQKISGTSLVIGVREEEKELFASIAGTLGIDAEIHPEPKTRLGGYLLYCRGKNIIIDQTFDEKLRRQREWFAAHSNLAVE